MNKDNKLWAVLKATGSVLLAVIASSHHWLHTLLIAIGLTSVGAGLFTMSPSVKVIFLLVSLIVSLWFLRVTKRKWHRDRAAAVVYLISSIISIILVITSLPQTFSDFNQAPVQQQEQQVDHDGHHG